MRLIPYTPHLLLPFKIATHQPLSICYHCLVTIRIHVHHHSSLEIHNCDLCIESHFTVVLTLVLLLSSLQFGCFPYAD